MSVGNKDFRQQADILRNLREQVRTLDAEIVDETTSIGDWKRVKARELMGALFGGLLECSITGLIVATFALAIAGYVPTEETNPGHSRFHYTGHSQVEHLVLEAEQELREISFVSEVGDGALQLFNGLRTDNPCASSTTPKNPPSNPHEITNIGEHNPISRSQTYPSAQRNRISSFDQSPPVDSTRSSAIAPFPPQMAAGFTPGHQPGPSAESEFHRVSSVSEIGDRGLQPPNWLRLDGVPPAPSSLIRSTSIQPIQPCVSPTLHESPPNDPHEFSNPDEDNSYPQFPIHSPARLARVASLDQSLASYTTSSLFTPFDPPRGGPGIVPGHQPRLLAIQELRRVSSVGEVGDRNLQLPNGSLISGATKLPPSSPGSPDQPASIPPPPPYTLSALHNNPSSDLNEFGDSGEYRPLPSSQTYTPAHQTRLSSIDEPLPPNLTSSSTFTQSPSPGWPGYNCDAPGFPPSSSSSLIRPTPAHQLATANEIYTDIPEMRNVERCVRALRCYVETSTDVFRVPGSETIRSMPVRCIRY